MQIEPFGGEDDACEPFDRDRRNKGKYSGKWTNFLNLCTAKKGIGKGGRRPLAAPPHQGGGRRLSSSAKPALSPWTHLGAISSERVEI